MTLGCLAAVIIYALVRAAACAAKRPFDCDELSTRLVSQLPGLSAIWKALNQGLDGQPPFYYLAVQSVARLVPNEHVGYRLLSVVAFAATLVLVYVFVKTRSGALAALISVFLLLMTELFGFYAFQARPYMLLVACTAAAMVCYQRAASGAWVAGLFLSLSLASVVHYYAVFPLAALDRFIWWRAVMMIEGRGDGEGKGARLRRRALQNRGDGYDLRSSHSSCQAVWMASSLLSLDFWGSPAKPGRARIHWCMSVKRTV
jgi:Dolichyl-phosphate-mannose-protein mannosyltransferase